MCYKQVLHCSAHDQFYTCRKTLQIDIELCTNQKALACVKMKVSTCVYVRHLKTIEKLVFLKFLFYVLRSIVSFGTTCRVEVQI